MTKGRASSRARGSGMIARCATALALVAPIGLVASLAFANASGAANAPTTTTTTRPPSSSSSGSSSAKSIATLKITAPDVTVQAKGESSFKAATDGQSLQAGDVVKTGPTGRAEVQYAADTFTRLDVNTTFKVVRLTDDQGNRRVQGSLDTGRTWNRTATLTQSQSFEQSGAGATAAVLGTAFAIDCDTPTHCTFYAVDHPIQMTDDAGQQILNPLQVIDVTDGDPSAITTLTIDQIAAISWIQQNLILDKLEGIGDGPFVPVTGVLVVQNGQVESFTPGDIPPPPAPTAPGAPTNVSAEPAGPGAATVSFDPPADNGGRPITGYTVVATANGQDPVTATGTGSPITVTGLTKGVTYDFTVTASNAIGAGGGSAPFALPIPPTAPGTPTNVSATPAGAGAASVSFDPPADGGSPITGYTALATAEGQDPVPATGKGSPITVTGLTKGVTYAFTVTATNTAGTGGASPPVDLPIPPTAPGAPAIVSAVATGPNSVDVTFTPPADDGGSPITGYTVTATAGADTRLGTGGKSSITVGELTDGETWTFTVTATNSVDTGPPSAPVDEATPAIPRFADDMIQNADDDSTPVDHIDDALGCNDVTFHQHVLFTLCDVINGVYNFTFVYQDPDAVDYVTFSGLPKSSTGSLYSVNQDTEEPESGTPLCRFSSDCAPVVVDTPQNPQQYDPDQVYQFAPSLQCGVAQLCPNDTTFTAVAHSDDPLVTETDTATVPVTVHDSRDPVDDGDSDAGQGGP